MLVLCGILLVLMTGWSFYAWFASESLQITWPRRFFAGLSVTLMAVVCLGGGFVVTRKTLQHETRQQVQRLTRALNQGVQDGRTTEVHEAIRILAEGPREGSGLSSDLLQRSAELITALEQGAVRQVAEKPAASNIR